ncbi:MAG TPA: TIGR01777 family oxidoreductase [Fimbriimonadaceae bacterium]|nr:TIGR01777 family oxidoreductase [Fimbriimonadaceae bacterium]
MKIVMAGGTGMVGTALRRYLAREADVVILSKRPGNVKWDAATLGDWAAELEGADVVINLAGKSINCRYTTENMTELTHSRIASTRVIGQAIAAAKNPPKLWLQASAASIYAHRYDAPNDEEHGLIGGTEPNLPPKWKAIVGLVKAWEAELDNAKTPSTRKIAMRSTIVMSPDKGGPFEHFAKAAKWGVGGRVGTGKQYVSWIHEEDFANAVWFLMEQEEISGPVNMTAPSPLPNWEFMEDVREAFGTRIGLPVPRWLLEPTMALMKSESELLLKSRRVIPGKLLNAGFEFKYETWGKACNELMKRWKATHTGLS